MTKSAHSKTKKLKDRLVPSKMGLMRIPQNPNQRGGKKPKGVYLDALNEANAPFGYYLHPTKGVRWMTLRRMRVATLTAELKNGATRLSSQQIRDDLKLAA